MSEVGGFRRRDDSLAHGQGWDGCSRSPIAAIADCSDQIISYPQAVLQPFQQSRTPHTWTAFGHGQSGRAVVQTDQRRWDYRHQVLAQRYLKPWQLFAAVKWLELRFHLRPRRLMCLLLSRDRFIRQQGWWTARHTGLVWVMEIIDFVHSVRFADHPRPLMDWLRRSGHAD